MRSIIAAIIAVALVTVCTVAACPQTLRVLDSKGAALGGIPIATYELWVAEGVYSKLTKGGACDSTTPYQRLTSIPTGPKYYVNAKGSLFSKTTLNVKLNSDGALTEISFGSESNLPETLTGLASVLKNAPSLGVAAAEAPPPGTLAACDTGEILKKLTRYDEWRQAH